MSALEVLTAKRSVAAAAARNKSGVGSFLAPRRGMVGERRTNSGELNLFMFCRDWRLSAYQQNGQNRSDGKRRRSKRPPVTRQGSSGSLVSLSREGSSRSLCSQADDEESQGTKPLQVPEPQPFVLFHRPLIALQSQIRRRQVQLKFFQFRQAVVVLQAYFRGYRARQEKPVLHLRAHLVRIEDQRQRQLGEIQQSKKAYIQKKARKYLRRAQRLEQEVQRRVQIKVETEAIVDQLRRENKRLRHSTLSIQKTAQILLRQQEELKVKQGEVQENLATLEAYVESLQQEIHDTQFVHDSFATKIEAAESTIQHQTELNELEKKLRILYGRKLDELLRAAKDYCTLGGAGAGTPKGSIVSSHHTKNGRAMTRSVGMAQQPAVPLAC